MFLTMHTLLNSVSATVMYILRFKGEEGGGNDYKVVDSLEDAMLSNILGGFQENEWIESFFIQPYDRERDELHLISKDVCNVAAEDDTSEALKANENVEEGSEQDLNPIKKAEIYHEARVDMRGDGFHYKEIKMPASLSLYTKVLNLAQSCDEPLSDDEIHSILHFLTSMDNASVIMCVLYRRFLGDCTLANRLEKQHAERAKEQLDAGIIEQGTVDCLAFDIKTAIRNVYNTVKRKYILFIKDQHGNVALGTKKQKNDVRLPLYVSLENVGSDIPGGFLKMDYQFLSYNKETLHRWINTLSEESPEMTVEVDFSNFFCVQTCPYEYTRVSAGEPNPTIPKDFYREIICGFILHKKITKVILRLSNTSYDFNLGFLNGKKLELWCYDCSFDKKSIFPKFVSLLSINDSLLKTSLVLPPRLKKLYVGNCRHENDAVELHVGSACKYIDINYHSGLVKIADMVDWNTLMLPLKCQFSVIIKKDQENRFKQIKVKNAKVINNWDISNTVESLHLEDVGVSDSHFVNISSNCKSVVIRHCVGFFRFSGIDDVNFASYSGSLEYVKDVHGKMRELLASNLVIDHNKSFKSSLRTIRLSNIELTAGAVISFEKNDEITEMVCEGCIGRFYFSGVVTGIGHVSFTEVNGCFELKRSVRENKLRLKIANVVLDEDLVLDDSVDEIIIENVVVGTGSRFKMCNLAKKIIIDRCEGEFIIHGLKTEEGTGIKLNNSSSSIHLSKVDNNKHSLYMANIVLTRMISVIYAVYTAVLKNVRIVDQQSIVFEKKCERLTLDNCDMVVRKEKNNIFRELCLRMLVSDVAHYYFSTNAEELTARDIELRSDVHISRNIKAIGLDRVSMSNDTCFVIEGDPNLVSLQECNGRFNLPFLTEARHENVLHLNGKQPSICFFQSKLFANSYILVIKDCEMQNTAHIRNDIKCLTLSCITGGFGMKVRASDCCMRLVVDNCEVGTTLANYLFITSLVMKRSFFIQDISSFVNLQALHLADISLQRNFTLNKHLKVFEITNSLFQGDYVLKLNSEIENLRIVRFSGVVDVSEVINMEEMNLHGTETFTIKRMKNSNDIFLGMRNMTIKKTLKIDPRVKYLELIEVTIEENTKLKVGGLCESLRLVDCVGRFDLSSATSLTIIDIEGVAVGWINFLAPVVRSKHETIFERLFPQSIKRFPGSLRSVKLVSQVVEQDVWLACDNECERVSLINCAGRFDLSEITRLKKFVYQPQATSNNSVIKFPDLNGVEELVLVYNGNTRYFQSLLVMCHNVKKLTLYSHKSPNSGIRFEDLVVGNLTIYQRLFVNLLKKMAIFRRSS